MTTNIRSPLTITLGTWKALFLREAVTRLSKGRDALWILLDPILSILFMLWMFTVVRMRVVGGIDTMVWLMIGITSYNLFRSTLNRAMLAVGTNRALFTYRQVKPTDTVLVRAVMEGFLMVLVILILFGGASLFGVAIIPIDPLTVLIAMCGLWLIGLGSSLILSVLHELVPELAKIITLLMMPLYLCSGVIFPIASIPASYRDWLVFNPLVHGVEAARLGFSPFYHAIPELNLLYLYGFALTLLFLGLALHVRFANKLLTL